MRSHVGHLLGFIALVSACGGSDAPPPAVTDAGSDGAPDVVADFAPEVAPDVALEVAREVAAETAIDMGPAAMCTTGAKRCMGNTPETCVDGQWNVGSVCPFVCSAGACTGVCVPASKRCAERNAQVCAADGQWSTLEMCPYACAGGTCTGTCTPGAKRCTNKAPETCDNGGQWVAGADCTHGCLQGACLGCTPGSTRCASGSQLETCSSAGEWQQGACGYRCVNPGTCEHASVGVWSGHSAPGWTLGLTVDGSGKRITSIAFQYACGASMVTRTVPVDVNIVGGGFASPTVSGCPSIQMTGQLSGTNQADGMIRYEWTANCGCYRETFDATFRIAGPL